MPPVSVHIPHRLRRWRVPAYVLLGVYLLYLLAGNIFLNTPLFDQVTNRKPHKFVMTTGPAITLLPGHVIARNVHMRGHVNHTVYALHAERASARLAVLPLFQREVRVPRLQATGFPPRSAASKKPSRHRRAVTAAGPCVSTPSTATASAAHALASC